MSAASLLSVPMFLLIFGPKTSGWIDIVSLTAGILVLSHFLLMNTAHVPRGVCQRTSLLLVIFSVLLGYAVFRCLLQTDPNTHQVLRFGRVVVNLLGIAALTSMYQRAYGAQASTTLVRHLFHCLVVHALIMVSMFYSTTFRDLIVNQIVQADPDSRTYLAKATGYRISGLTDSWDALSGLQSLGLLLLPLLLTHQPRISYGHAVLAAPLLIFSIAISGRTGFVTLGLLLPVALAYADLRRMYRATCVMLVVGALSVIVIRGPLRDASVHVLESTSLGRTMSMFGWHAGSNRAGDQLGDTFSGILHEHYFLPTDWQTLLLGSGGSGRDNWDYVPADNGPVLNLHNLGLGCFVLIYGSLIWLFSTGAYVRGKSPQVAGASVLAVMLIGLIDIKVMYVCSRNGFTVMLLPVFAAWWEAASTGGACRGQAREIAKPRSRRLSTQVALTGAPQSGTHTATTG